MKTNVKLCPSTDLGHLQISDILSKSQRDTFKAGPRD